MCDLRLVRLKTALWRLIEGLLLLAGAASLMRLASDGGDILLSVQQGHQQWPSSPWIIGLLITLGVVGFLVGFVATMQAIQWLYAIIIRGPFVMLGTRRADQAYELRTISADEVQEVLNHRFLTKSTQK